MKFCPECGNSIEGQKFCSECGYKVEVAAASPSNGIPVSQPIAISQPASAPLEQAPTGRDAIKCPHCGAIGTVSVKKGKKKKGISGGKATAAVLTGGISLLATGLAKKDKVQNMQCSHCGMKWTVE